MYQNPDDTAAIADAKEDFKDIVFTQFGSNIPFMNGTEPWPKVVADAMVFQRRNDGSGNPDSMNPFLVSLTNRSEEYDWTMSVGLGDMCLLKQAAASVPLQQSNVSVKAAVLCNHDACQIG
jgi:hypothetical protein